MCGILPTDKENEKNQPTHCYEDKISFMGTSDNKNCFQFGSQICKKNFGNCDVKGREIGGAFFKLPIGKPTESAVPKHFLGRLKTCILNI